MASYVKFHCFVEDLAEKVHNLGSDALKIYLTNATPSASGDAIKTDLAEISTGFGYAGPQAVTVTTSAQSGGTYTLAGNQIVITASGGSVGPFQYAVLFNDTPASPLDPLISYWDYGSPLTLATGETFTWKPSGTDPGTILTLG
jgi:hypothetical protein